MDLRMPGGDGRRVAPPGSRRPGCPSRVIVLTTYETDRDILRAVEAGAAGYLLKDAAPGRLADAVRAAARGETVLAPVGGGHAWSTSCAPAGRPPARRRARRQVLRLVARGLHERGDRPAAVHQRVDGEDPSAARLRQAGRRRPHRRRSPARMRLRAARPSVRRPARSRRRPEIQTDRRRPAVRLRSGDRRRPPGVDELGRLKPRPGQRPDSAGHDLVDARHRRLLAGLHVLELDDALGEVALAGDERVARAASGWRSSSRP